VEAVGDGGAAESRALAGGFDAILLDVMLPDLDGFAVCRRLRSKGVDTPILLLTGRQELSDRVRGLDAGADDYLSKPFAFEELLARLRALTRRGRTHHLDASLSCGTIEINQRDHTVAVNGAPIEVTDTEFRLLEYLVLRADRVVTREELVTHVWGDTGGHRSNVIDVYVSYIRKKLGASAAQIRTVRRMGYTIRIAPDVL